MTLGFTTAINHKPTHFVEKIWTGFPLAFFKETWDLEYTTPYYEKFGYPPEPIKPSPKIHSIRVDEKNRWKVGMNIHFVVGNRTKHRFQFAPIIPVTRIQKIEIEYLKEGEEPNIFIDGLLLYEQKELDRLALNDGFESYDEFLTFFKEDFTGNLIQWTNFKY